jgi:hypothetical protein
VSHSYWQRGAKRSDTKLIEGEEESLLSLEEDLEPKRIG